MSHASGRSSSITVATIQQKRENGEPISVVTCYDAAFGRIIEASPVDVVLVGDSLGNVVLGFDSTIPVTLDHMIHHTAAVTRVVTRPFVVSDMPFMTYATVETALTNAAKLVQNGGASGVKLEGGENICAQVDAIVKNGIPVMGHLGLTPQSVHALGGYKLQAKDKEAQQRLISDAKALQDAGAFSIVLEMIPSSLAMEVTRQLRIPTIGIGAGRGCSGQVLVLHDLLGFNSKFTPKFLKTYAALEEIVGDALRQYDKDVKMGKFPAKEHSFGP